jgi:hypothetical protein
MRTCVLALCEDGTQAKMSDRRHDNCTYEASRRVETTSGSIYGPYCIGHAEDFIRKIAGRMLMPQHTIAGPVACRADWMNAAEVPS